LFGVISTSLSNDEVKDAQFLGLLSTTRGVDSTGIAVFGRGKKNKVTLRTHRKVDNFLSFMKDKEAHDACSAHGRFLLMGHTRWATLGAVNLRNAHPIEEGGIVLCHNGSVDHFLRDKKSEDDSDSREIARRLNKQGLEKTMHEIAYSAAAMTYVNLPKQTFTLSRNGGRPLCYMFNKGNNTMYWASSEWILNALREKEGKDKFGSIFGLAEDIDYRFKLGQPLATREVIKLKPKPTVVYSSSNDSPFRHKPMFCHICQKHCDSCDCWDEKNLRLPGIIPVVPSVPLLPKPAGTRPTDAHLYQGYKGVKLTVGAVLPVLQKGCASCGKPGALIQTSKWMSDDWFLCEKCYDSDDVVTTHGIKNLVAYDGYLLAKDGSRWQRT
jgi:predicted glutamine amidotransferase